MIVPQRHLDEAAVAEYGLPAERWAMGIEEQILRVVKKLVEKAK